ncbi:MAG: ferrous iron transport protein B, partial [Anaerolineae bacterium]
LLSLPAPVVVGLNMIDVAQQEGLEIEPQVLEAALGVPVVPMVATRNVGVRELLQTVDQIVREERCCQPNPPHIRDDHREVLEEIEALIMDRVPPPYPRDWVALKLLEGDREITAMMRKALSPEVWEAVHDVLKAHDDALVAVAGGRYEWIGRMVRAAVTRPKAGQISLTERIDRWATHPVWGLLILAGILGGTFWLTYTVGTPLQDLMELYVVRALANLARIVLAGAPGWLVGLVADGIIGGVGAVLTFLPILVIFFAVMAALEDIGYMARAAYVMDGFMHLMGLHGKSFLPLFLGFGCNVPAVLGSRVIESKRARLLTILLAPLIPCTARMTILAFLTPAFFGPASTFVAWGLILLALTVVALSGILMNRVFFHGQRAAFIMELPLYHAPNWRTIGLLVWQRSIAFVKKAGTLILTISVVIWTLSVLPSGDMGESYLAAVGRAFAPVGQLMGLDWRLMVALLTSFIAKENSIATLGVIFGTGSEGHLPRLLAATYSPATGLAFLVVQMLFIPCIATVAVVHQETKSIKWTLFDLGFLMVVSGVAGTVTYHIATAVGL